MDEIYIFVSPLFLAL